jgi:hypothetical protein
MRRTLFALSVMALATAGCASRDAASPSPERSTGVGQREARLSARIVLPSTRVAAGAMLPGRVVVENSSGRPLHVSGCGSPFAVVLRNDEIRPVVAWPTCLEQITIPAGTSSWPVTVAATYSGCGRGNKRVPPCEDGLVPPLPVGKYQAVLFQSPHVVPKPASIEIRVVPCRCAS